MNILQLIPYIIGASLTVLLCIGIQWLTSGVMYFRSTVEAVAIWLILSIVAAILVTFVTLKTQQLASDYQLKLTHQVYDNYCLV